MLNFSKVDKRKTIQDENIVSFLKRRNGRILKFFRDKGYNNVRLVGNPEKPAIVLNGDVLLNAYVNNFDLLLLDSNDDSKRYKVKLSFEGIDEFEQENLVDFINNVEHDKIYRIKLTDVDMYYAGYYSEEGDVNNPFMMFSVDGFKAYYNKEKADEVANVLQSKGYKVSVV